MSFDLQIGPEHLKPALLAALASVSMLTALFAYLNCYTRRRYFQIWMVAWLFYAFWLTLTYHVQDQPAPFALMVRNWAVGISAIFLSWGSLIFMGQKVSQRMLRLLILFLVAWSYVGTYHLDNPWHAQVPIFTILGVSNLLAARGFFIYRMRKEFAGATLLCAGFTLWGLFLIAYPFAERTPDLAATIFVVAAMLQLFIAVSMIILVLEEARRLRRTALDKAATERAARRGMEDRVRSTEARYRQLFEQASDAIVVTSRQGFEILELNRHARQLLGVTGELSPGTLLDSFLRRTAAPRAKSDTQSLDCALPGAPMNIVSRDGRTSAVAVERSAIEIGGEPAYQFVLKELTERFQLEQQIRQAEKLSALGQMISGVAHELNNPLAIIKGRLDLVLDRDDLPPGLRNDLEKVAREGNRAAKLVGNFLSFARETPPEHTSVQLNALVESVVELRHFDSLVAQSTIKLDLAPALPPIKADADQVQQVLANLISNSLHAILAVGRPGQIVIRTRSTGTLTTLRIEDNGPGVPVDFQSKIFEPFFTTKETGAGTGLGLSIAHGIMCEHGGRILYSASELGGAAFTLEFPRAAAVVVSRPTTSTETTVFRKESFVTEHGRVLVLDDEEALAEMVGEALGQYGHDVVIAFTPLQALEHLRLERFDVIVSDFRMPTLNGRDFHAEVRLIDSALASRIIFLTGDTVSEDTREFFDSVGNPRLAKPFQLDAVARAVNEMLLRAAA